MSTITLYDEKSSIQTITDITNKIKAALKPFRIQWKNWFLNTGTIEVWFPDYPTDDMGKARCHIRLSRKFRVCDRSLKVFCDKIEEELNVIITVDVQDTDGFSVPHY